MGENALKIAFKRVFTVKKTVTPQTRNTALRVFN
jgi:hypothetical protein